jgi:RNA polymerase sigma-70 factor, ECF subfamily
MRLVAEGDARAFEVIFDRHSGVAFSLAYRMCGRQPMAEDVVQESFLSLWRAGARYNPSRGTVRAWVLSVVHNRAVDAFRHDATKHGRVVQADGLVEGVEADERTDLEVERRDDAQAVRGALRELPPDQREVIELAYFGGFTHSEIAQMLKLPPGTVKGRMRLGLAKLGTALPDRIALLT